MNITQVKVFPVQEEKLKAFVSIVFDHCFMVNDIKVIQGKDGLFLSMPSRRKRSGEFKDVAHPLNHETRREIELKVLEEYRHVVDDATPRRPDRVEGDDPAESAPEAAAVAPVAALGDRPSRNGSDPGRHGDTPRGEEPAPVAAASGEAPSSDEATRPDEAKTLEEVQEAHLSDSFWSVS